MRTTVDVDEGVLAAARAMARDTKMTLGQAISELALRGLRSAQTPANAHAFPIFVVSDAAPPLTLEQVNEHRDGD